MGKDQTLILGLKPFAVRRCLSVRVPGVQIKKFISVVPDEQIKGKKVRRQNKNRAPKGRYNISTRQNGHVSSYTCFHSIESIAVSVSKLECQFSISKPMFLYNCPPLTAGKRTLIMQCPSMPHCL